MDGGTLWIYILRSEGWGDILINLGEVQQIIASFYQQGIRFSPVLVFQLKGERVMEVVDRRRTYASKEEALEAANDLLSKISVVVPKVVLDLESEAA